MCPCDEGNLGANGLAQNRLAQNRLGIDCEAEFLPRCAISAIAAVNLEAAEFQIPLPDILRRSWDGESHEQAAMVV